MIQVVLKDIMFNTPLNSSFTAVKTMFSQPFYVSAHSNSVSSAIFFMKKNIFLHENNYFFS